MAITLKANLTDYFKKNGSTYSGIVSPAPGIGPQGGTPPTIFSTPPIGGGTSPILFNPPLISGGTKPNAFTPTSIFTVGADVPIPPNNQATISANLDLMSANYKYKDGSLGKDSSYKNIYWNNASMKYRVDSNAKTRFEKIKDGNTKIDTAHGFNPVAYPKKSLYDLYKENNYSKVSTKFSSFNKPYIVRGIQKDSPDNEAYKSPIILGSAKDMFLRLIKSQDPTRTNFLIRRGFNKLFSLQSRFALGTPGIHLVQNTVLLPLIDPLHMASALAWSEAGTIARIPYSMGDYALTSGIGRYGFGGGLKKSVWATLKNLDNKVKNSPTNNLVPFYFINKTDPKNEKVLQFRGTIKSLSHSLTPQWSNKKYFGRPDQVSTYTGFGQTISFNWMVDAEHQSELKGMYEDLEELQKLVKPGWDETKSFMIGPVCLLTIGDYVVEQPGFLTTLTITPDEQIPWDIGWVPGKAPMQVSQMTPQGLEYAGQSRKKVLPRLFQIGTTFTIIENETPNNNFSDRTPFYPIDDGDWH